MPTSPSTSQPESPRQLVATGIVDGIRAGKLELPVMPRVASRILKMAQDPEADMDALSQLIHSDPTIASHVLRIANSAAYGTGEPIVSLQQAVTRLGMKLLGEIAIAVSLQNSLPAPSAYQEQIRRLFKHALASASFGREIARARRRNVEGQFLCGLLHSIGKPICLQLISVVAQEKAIDLRLEDSQAIVEKLNQKIASRVAVEWRLPKQLQVAAAYFRRYDEAPAFKDECAATYLSQLLATWALSGKAGDETDLRLDPVVQYLNFYPKDVQNLLGKRDEVQAAVAALHL